MLKNYFIDDYDEFKKNDNLFYKSFELVCRLFEDKEDKSGIPYIVHLSKVCHGVDEYIEKVCALLHDVVEDTDVTFDDLREFGYDEEVIEILSYLTKHKGEDYRDYN